MGDKPMNRKITVIGAGNVGSTIAYTLSKMDLASEIVLIDINENKLVGEAMDIQQSTVFYSTTHIVAGDYPDAADSGIVIITSGLPRKPGQTRLDLTKANVEIMKSIAPRIAKYAPDAIYLIVSNPVDIMTYVFAKVSGIPESRVIGSGTTLDTARLRSKLAKDLDLAEKSVHAYVLGEHGDTSFIPWSLVRISSLGLEEFSRSSGMISPESRIDFQKIEKDIVETAAKIISGKGATYYAVAAATCHLVKCLYSSAETSAVVSTVLHGEYGIEDVALSMHTLIGNEGVKMRMCCNLTAEEYNKLRHSANTLKSIIADLDLTMPEEKTEE